ncbi:MAG TPA: glycosyl hydrolase [Acidobacteriota bacterium]|nr:glycosyl hydrolase [Acidobacteriota bacterium]
MDEQTFKGLSWRNIGPGLMSGRIADIAVHPRDASTWYVAVGSGGVWKTANRGASWQPVFDGQSSYSIGCVTIDPNQPDVIWVGTGENVSGRHVGYGNGVYKSLDGGASWTNMGLESSEHIGKILVDPRDSNVVYVAAEGPLWSSGGERGLYKSTDGGATWTPSLVISEATGATDLEFDPSNPDVLYAAVYQRRRTVWAHLAGGPESGIYKSTDAGANWRRLDNGLPSGDMGKIGLAVSPLRHQVVYATIEASEDEAGFYRSEDGGESWEKRNSYISGGTGPHYYQEIYASPHAFDRVYQMDVWIRVTHDGGRTFEELGETSKHSDSHAMAFTDDPDYLLAGCDGGLYESYDHAASWKFVSNLPVTQIYKMALDNDEPFYNVIAGTQDNGTIYGPSRTTRQHGILNRDWWVPFGADGYATQIDPEDPDILYLEWQNGHLLRYDRQTREPVDIQPQPGPGDAPERWNWDAPVLISPHSHTRLYYGSQRLWRSDDRGDSWSAVSQDLSRGQNRYELPMGEAVPGMSALYDNGAMSWYGNITSISESPLQEGLIYVGTDDGLVQITEDGGRNWLRVDLPDVPDLAFVNDITASLHDADTVFAVFDNHKTGDFNPYLVKSGDRGRTWTSINGNLPEGQILWGIVQDHVDPDLLFAAAEFGIYFTLDGGSSWIKLSGNAPTIAFRDLEIQRRENDLVGASFGRGFFVLDDYSALRHVDQDLLASEGTLLPVRKALAYIPSVDLGVRDKGYQGTSLYLAENPPFGALLTYFWREPLTTAVQERTSREQEMRQEGEDVPFPGWDALREEELEVEPQLMILISDQEGQVIRRIPAPASPGIQRVAWDLRYPSPEPTRLEERQVPIWSNPPAGPLVAPGTYTAQLAVLSDGDLRPLGQEQSIEVEYLDHHSLPAGDRDEILAFQLQTWELVRDAAGAAEALEDAVRRLRFMRQSVLDTPGAPSSLLVRIRSARLRAADLQEDLTGDLVRPRYNEPSAPSILGRAQSVAEGHWYTTVEPTQTQRRSIRIASQAFAGVREELTRLHEELGSLEEALQAAGAPYTPGRRPR